MGGEGKQSNIENTKELSNCREIQRVELGNEMTQRRQEMGEEGNKLQLGSLQLEGFQSLGSYLSDNECLNHS